MFDIFVISLALSERRPSIAKALNDRSVAFRFEDAFDARCLTDSEIDSMTDRSAAVRRYGRMLTRGEIGCFTSHRAVWRKVVTLGRSAVVLEDDALLDNGFFEHVLTAEERGLNAAADIVLLGRSKLRQADAKRAYLREPLKRLRLVGGLTVGIPFKQWTSGTVGYWISPEGARKALAHTERATDMLIDDWPLHRDRGGICVAELRPYVVWEAFETMPSSLDAARRAQTRGRSALLDALLGPLRVLRTIGRWSMVAVLTVTASRKQGLTSHE